MTTRVPLLDPADLSVDDSSPTADLAPVRTDCALEDIDDARFAVGSGRDMDAVESTAERRKHLLTGTPPIAFDTFDIANSEWGRRLTESAASSDLRWKWTRRGLAVLGPAAVTALWLGLGWLRSSGVSTGAANERELQRIETRAAVLDLQAHTIPELRAAIAANSAAIANLRGALDMINRLGAVRVVGPQPQPLLPVTP